MCQVTDNNVQSENSISQVPQNGLSTEKFAHPWSQ